MYPEHAENAQDLLQGAHSAVYCAKARGRGAWCFYNRDMTEAARERLELEARLRVALAQPLAAALPAAGGYCHRSPAGRRGPGALDGP